MNTATNKRDPRATILHVDMDAFYAAIEVLDHPELAGKPVVVGAPPDRRGVVSTASYEARAFGIHSALPSRTAGKLCPHAVFLPVRMKRYAEVSDQVMNIFESFTPLVEQVSVDEAFLDVAGVMRRWKKPAALARALKEKIHAELRLTASVGVAPNKFLAKLGSDLEKPDGLTLMPNEPREVASFLAAMPIERMWGVGKVTARKLAGAGLHTFGDVQQRSTESLARILGVGLAEHIQPLAFGRDDRPVVTDTEAKSISAEHTFDEDCAEPAEQRQVLLELAERVGRRLRRAGQYARVGHIKVRLSDFSTRTRQKQFSRFAHTDRELLACALGLLRRENIREPVRLLGFGVSGLSDEADTPIQPELFPEDVGDVDRERDERLDRAVDRLRDDYGRDSIRRGEFK